MKSNEPTGSQEKSQDVEQITEQLAAPFDPSEVKFKPAVVSGNRAIAIAYVDARVIQDRLDEVVGVMGWQDEYECMADGAVVCRLRIRINEEWITKMDVGGPSEQPDEGDRRKAAFSDALKRAAVKFGIGRYLYRLPVLWVGYDPQRRQFVPPPQLPAEALPKKPSRKVAATAPAVALPPKVESAAGPAGKNGQSLPASGEELQRRLALYDERLAGEGLCQPGDLVKHVQQAGRKAGYPEDLKTWTGAAIVLAVEQTRIFESQRRKTKKPRKEVA